MKQKTLKKSEFSLRERFNSDLKRNYQLYILASPFILLFAVFVVLPVVISIFLSFTYYNMIETPRFIGLSNYTQMFFGDDVFWVAFKNTMIFAVITGPTGYVLSFVLAWFINELNPKIRAVVTFIYYAPALTGNVYFIWQYIFSGDRYGFINNLLLELGFILEPIQWLSDTNYMLTVVIIVQLWLSLGVSFLSFIAGFQSVDNSLYEAGAIDGVKNRWQELWYITLPVMKPQMMFGAIMQISTAFSVGAISQTLVGYPSKNYAAHTIVLHIMDFGTIRYEMGYACAISVFLFLIMVIFKSLVTRILSVVAE